MNNKNCDQKSCLSARSYLERMDLVNIKDFFFSFSFFFTFVNQQHTHTQSQNKIVICTEKPVLNPGFKDLSYTIITN